MHRSACHTFSFSEAEVAEALKEYAEKRTGFKLNVEDIITVDVHMSRTIDGDNALACALVEATMVTTEVMATSPNDMGPHD